MIIFFFECLIAILTLHALTIAVYYTEKNDHVNLHYECILNLREDFMRTLHDFTYMLLSVTVQDVESTVQDIEIKGVSVNSTAFSY